MRTTLRSALLVLPLFWCGCSDLDAPPRGKSIPAEETPTDRVPEEQTLPPTDTTTDPSVPDLPATPADLVDPTSAATELPAETPPTEAETEQVVAEAGVGIQGQSLTPGSMITEPARAFFNTKQRLVFIQVEQALQLYKATNDSVPQSTEEFMEQVIKPNGIQLPELPRGHSYVFDPEAGNLMVEKPKRN